MWNAQECDTHDEDDERGDDGEDSLPDGLRVLPQVGKLGVEDGNERSSDRESDQQTRKSTSPDLLSRQRYNVGQRTVPNRILRAQLAKERRRRATRERRTAAGASPELGRSEGGERATDLNPHPLDQPSDPLVIVLLGSLEGRSIHELLDEREQDRDDDRCLLWKRTNERRAGQVRKKSRRALRFMRASSGLERELEKERTKDVRSSLGLMDVWRREVSGKMGRGEGPEQKGVRKRGEPKKEGEEGKRSATSSLSDRAFPRPHLDQTEQNRRKDAQMMKKIGTEKRSRAIFADS